MEKEYAELLFSFTQTYNENENHHAYLDSGELRYASKPIAAYKIPKSTEGTVCHIFYYNALTR